MANAKLARFANSRQVLACPVCRSALDLQGNSLTCGSRHCFDVAKQGYANLLTGAKQSAHYSLESFQNREGILEKGYYGHILDAVLKLVGDAVTAAGGSATLLDVGCGEGFYSRALQDSMGDALDIVAFDISKDAARLAARTDAGTRIKWLVADLAGIPVQDRSIDCILDVFSPSNYAEFKRVLAPGGRLIKVIPGERHVAEFRELAADQLRSKEYSNQLVADRFEEFFAIESRTKVSRTFPMPLDDLRDFAHMTPVLFGVDVDALDFAPLAGKGLTIEAEVLVGTAR